MKTTKPKRGVGNPTWIRNAVEAEQVRQIHNQWCRDNGYAIRGKYGRKARDHAPGTMDQGSRDI